MSKQVEFLNEHPSFNKDFFEKILKAKYDTDTIVLKDFTFDRTKDENYGIQMTRVKLYYSFSGNDNMDIVCSTCMLKTCQMAEDVEDVLGRSNVFLKEIIFYLEILPHLYNVMDGKTMDSTLAPRCFAAENRSSFIVFEDLTKKGYKKVNNWYGLDNNHLKITLSKLAEFHAASACFGCKDQLPPMLNIFRRTCDKPELFQFFKKPIVICAEMSASWTGFEKISKKLYDLETKITEKVENMFKATKFNVILHGDLWSNNLMYLYDKDEKPVDVIMLDYSSAYWGSPSIDIAYLLYSSSSNDVGSNEWCELIDHYHQELTANLSILNYPGYIPSLDDINEGISANSVPIIAITASVNGLRFAENSQNAKMLSMGESSKFMFDLMSTPIYKKRMESLLTYYESMGFLD